YDIDHRPGWPGLISKKAAALYPCDLHRPPMNSCSLVPDETQKTLSGRERIFERPYMMKDLPGFVVFAAYGEKKRSADSPSNLLRVLAPALPAAIARTPPPKDSNGGQEAEYRQ